VAAVQAGAAVVVGPGAAEAARRAAGAAHPVAEEAEEAAVAAEVEWSLP